MPGADLALSYASLGVESAFALLQGREIAILGEGVEIFTAPLPEQLAGMTLAESEIGSRTGLSVITVQQNGRVIGNPQPTTVLEAGSDLVLLGICVQRDDFEEMFR